MTTETVEWGIVKDCYGNRFSWYTAVNTTVLYHRGLIISEILFKLKNVWSSYAKVS